MILNFYFAHMSMFASMDVCVHVCRGHRGHQSPWTWSYRQLQRTICVLGIEPESSAREASALNHQTMSPAPFSRFLTITV